jgi:di/tricarboxylate transporter
VLLVLLQIVTSAELYSGTPWPVIVLIGAYLPVSTALGSTGAADLAVGLLAPVAMPALAGVGPVILVAAVSIAAWAAAHLVGTAVAVLTLAPIVGGLAARLGVSADPLLMAVAVGASCGILTPSSRTMDGAALAMPARASGLGNRWHTGLPLASLLVALGIPLILLVWPMHP